MRYLITKDEYDLEIQKAKDAGHAEARRDLIRTVVAFCRGAELGWNGVLRQDERDLVDALWDLKRSALRGEEKK